ncbi:GNAT family N-acetyltransferase [Caulobacter sp. DWP3-1-3b2]|uniref:GNAT family N-acetyltransferase n=1 Tax=Caulobacter sp. DWP3-1-3b2 TaxID=2804643 RepID=UPI003CE9B1C5
MIIDPRLLEPIADRAWPARETAALGGWRLKASDGWSRRINACWPLDEPGRPADEAIDAVEAFYAARGAPACFKLADGAAVPANLAEHLTARGYRPAHETLVMTGATTGDADEAVTLSATPDPAFEAVFLASAAGNAAEARERLDALGRIPAPAFFGRMDIDGQTAALGAAAVEGDWAGIFGMRTLPGHRRKGLARRILGALLDMAEGQGARRAYLQVEADNAPAIALYSGLGFAPAYCYRYWAVGA